MKIEDYISSGVLESYVLGQLSKEDSQAVEKMATKYPTVRKEIGQIEDALNAYAMSHSKAPSPALKDKILGKLDEKRSKSSGKIVSINGKGRFSTFLVAASLILTLVSSAAAIYFWQKYETTKGQLATLQADNLRIAKNYKVNNSIKDSLNHAYTSLGRLQSEIAILRDTNTLFVPLKGLPLSPASKVSVLWKKDSKEVYVDVKSLPAPPTDMQYQLWAMEDGKPVDAGLFDVSDSLGLQRMKTIQAAQAFAVTLEKKGGSEFPTLDNMYVMGKVN